MENSETKRRRRQLGKEIVESASQSKLNGECEERVRIGFCREKKGRKSQMEQKLE